jgi:hypothetical protein
MAGARLALAAAAGAMVLAACGLDFVGSMVSAEVVGTDAATDAPPPDAASTTDADAGCITVPVDDDLTSLDPMRWLVTRSGGNNGYPKTDSLGVVFVNPNEQDERGAIWLEAPVPTRSFDIAFYAYISGNAPHGDGLAIAWLATTDEKVLNANDLGTGGTYGIPKAVRGGGVLFDVYANGPAGDGPVPQVAVLAIDGSRAPGNYDWHAAKGPKNDNLVSRVLEVAIKRRAGRITVTVGGEVEVDSAADPEFIGSFGITAATGGDRASFRVRSLKATFSSCELPP